MTDASTGLLWLTITLACLGCSPPQGTARSGHEAKPLGSRPNDAGPLNRTAGNEDALSEPSPLPTAQDDEPPSEPTEEPNEFRACSGEAVAPQHLEGTVVRHCVYGPPNYGEDPEKDSKGYIGVLVLDRPVAELKISGAWVEHVCIRDAGAFHTVPESESEAPSLTTLYGKRVRLAVHELMQAVTGHHYGKAVLRYDSAEVLGPASRAAVRQAQRAAAEMIARPCHE